MASDIVATPAHVIEIATYAAVMAVYVAEMTADGSEIAAYGAGMEVDVGEMTADASEIAADAAGIEVYVSEMTGYASEIMRLLTENDVTQMGYGSKPTATCGPPRRTRRPRPRTKASPDPAFPSTRFRRSRPHWVT